MVWGVSRETIEALSACVHHRGPDDGGLWIDGAVGLGHRRLSIIDLAGSQQPMTSADGRWVAGVQRRDLQLPGAASRAVLPVPHARRHRDDLAGLASGTASASSTSSSASSPSRPSTGPPGRSPGPRPARCAAALLQPSPVTDASLRFGDQGDPRRHGPASPSRRLQSLDAYLYGAIRPRAAHAVRRRSASCRPATRIEVHAERGVREHPLLAASRPGRRRVDGARGCRRGRDAAVTDAVRAALVADVPVGAYLSGGVDSSLIVATAAASASARPPADVRRGIRRSRDTTSSRTPGR